MRNRRWFWSPGRGQRPDVGHVQALHLVEVVRWRLRWLRWSMFLRWLAACLALNQGCSAALCLQRRLSAARLAAQGFGGRGPDAHAMGHRGHACALDELKHRPPGVRCGTECGARGGCLFATLCLASGCERGPKGSAAFFEFGCRLFCGAAPRISSVFAHGLQLESASLQSESQTPTRRQTNATRKQAKGGRRKERKEERQREGAREKRMEWLEDQQS